MIMSRLLPVWGLSKARPWLADDARALTRNEIGPGNQTVVATDECAGHPDPGREQGQS